MDETQLFPRKIVFGEVDVTQGGWVDRNIFDELGQSRPTAGKA